MKQSQPISPKTHIVNLLQAEGPRSLERIHRELLTQAQGVTQANVEQTARDAILQLIRDEVIRQVEEEEDPHYELMDYL